MNSSESINFDDYAKLAVAEFKKESSHVVLIDRKIAIKRSFND
jgi:hypothetical protein